MNGKPGGALCQRRCDDGSWRANCGAWPELRRSVLSDFVFGGISAGALVGLAARVPLETPASQGVAAIVVTLFSLALLRSVANAMSVLETPCPRCDRAFFGGARMAIPALPLPPRARVHCGADLPCEIPAG